MNLSAFSAAPCSLNFSDMATPLVDGCRDAFIVSPNGVATHTPMHTVKPGSARQGQMPRSLQRKAVCGSWAATGADKCDPSTQRPAAGPDFKNVRCHGVHSVFLSKKSLPNASEFFGAVRKGIAHAG